MRVIVWSSDGCSSDRRRAVTPLCGGGQRIGRAGGGDLRRAYPWHHRRARLEARRHRGAGLCARERDPGLEPRRLCAGTRQPCGALSGRSEEHTSELQSLMRISYAVFCLKKKKTKITIE